MSTPSPNIPILTPPGGVYLQNQVVTITADEGTTIYYTIDGSTPTSDFSNTATTLYDTPIITQITYPPYTINAVAVLGEEQSAMASEEYPAPTPNNQSYLIKIDDIAIDNPTITQVPLGILYANENTGQPNGSQVMLGLGVFNNQLHVISLDYTTSAYSINFLSSSDGVTFAQTIAPIVMTEMNTFATVSGGHNIFMFTNTNPQTQQQNAYRNQNRPFTIGSTLYVPLGITLDTNYTTGVVVDVHQYLVAINSDMATYTLIDTGYITGGASRNNDQYYTPNVNMSYALKKVFTTANNVHCLVFGCIVGDGGNGDLVTTTNFATFSQPEFKDMSYMTDACEISPGIVGIVGSFFDDPLSSLLTIADTALLATGHLSTPTYTLSTPFFHSQMNKIDSLGSNFILASSTAPLTSIASTCGTVQCESSTNSGSTFIPDTGTLVIDLSNMSVVSGAIGNVYDVGFSGQYAQNSELDVSFATSQGGAITGTAITGVFFKFPIGVTPSYNDSTAFSSSYFLSEFPDSDTSILNIVPNLYVQRQGQYQIIQDSTTTVIVNRISS